MIRRVLTGLAVTAALVLGGVVATEAAEEMHGTITNGVSTWTVECTRVADHRYGHFDCYGQPQGATISPPPQGR